MADKQSEALRLSIGLHKVITRCDDHYTLDRAAAVELIRQYELIAELVDLLKDAASQARPADYDWPLCLSRAVDAAIAKAEEAQ